jgi:3-deoxy-7-phosphoheptulonate synthase
MATVARGQAFLVQGGACAETFADASRDRVDGVLSLLRQVALVAWYAIEVPTVLVGRMAGQYAKPRSEPTEVRNGIRLPAYLGDAVNERRFDVAARTPDPARMVHAYAASAHVLAHMRRFVKTGGLSARRALDALDMSITDAHRPLLDRIARAVTDRPGEGHPTGVFASHEALLLDYEAALRRPAPRAGGVYGSSGHLLWIGDRTRDADGAHVELLRHLANPLAVKLGPTAGPDDAIALANRLDPDNEPGRLTFVVRMGVGGISELLPPIVERVRAVGRTVGWVCDPMHANTWRTANGRKTRRLVDIVEEVSRFFDIHHALGTWPGGLHLEVAGNVVTECVGGTDPVDVTDLERRYESACDPRLNPAQAIDLVAELAAKMTGRPGQRR